MIKGTFMLKVKLFKKIWDKIGNCEFKKQCKYFDKESGVCLNGGGNYCGQYKEFSLKGRAKLINQKNV